MKKPRVSVEIPEHLQAAVNKLVRYYLSGWRAGYLEGFTKVGAAIIRPIGAIGGTKPHNIEVELTDVELLTHSGDGVAVYDEVVTEAEIIENVAAETAKRNGETVVAITGSLIKKTKRGRRL